jgi:NADPH:quinone reductase-like Zn-dependent oxidoreductase
MLAASLNFRDLLMVTGRYNPRQPLPLVPLSDGCGVVEAVGPGVAALQVGERVATCFAQGWVAGKPTRAGLKQTLGGPLDGTLREAMVLPELGVVPVPDHLSDVEAATLPCAALTAWTALVEHGQVAPGETVLVQGTGGVSIFALQFARMAGARVIATSSSPAKLQRALDLGAHDGIDHKAEPAWGKRALELTGGAGVDHVVEVGGGGTLQESLRAVKPGGHVALIGVLSGSSTSASLLPILMQAVRVHGVLVGHREAFLRMNRAIGCHQLRPVVDRVFPWHDARTALEVLQSGQHFGKICVSF